MLTTILSIIGTIIPIILQNKGVIGASTANLITGLEAQGVNLITGLATATTKTSDALAALAALSGVLAVLKANTALPATTLTQIANLDADVQAALKGYATAGTGYDPILYTQIAEVA